MIKVLLTPDANRKFQRASSSVQHKLLAMFKQLSHRKEIGKRLFGTELYVVRVGDQFLIIDIDLNTILVVDILPRNEFMHILPNLKYHY